MKCLSASCFFRFSIVRFLWAVAFILSVLPAAAQRGEGGMQPTQPTPAPRQPDSPSPNNPWDRNDLIYGKGSKPGASKIGTDSCFLPPLEASAPASVSVSDLQIPAKAKREHDDGCLALRKGKIVDAEHHFRKAVNQWPKYSDAWVVLGQVLEVQQKTKAATDACSQPLTTDSNYLPTYLCLADIFCAHAKLGQSTIAQQPGSGNWVVGQFQTDPLPAIDSTTIAVAYDYNAAAWFHLHNLSEAEKSALRAVEIDKSNIDPRVHFLLAQIYEEKGDRSREAAQLREYLKYASDPNDVSMVKNYLSEIEKQTQ
jgi:Tfp pilus assembly protein PilF